jgi:triosephosphate isomerase
MSKALVIGNWKMNLDYVEAVHLTQQIAALLASRPAERVDVVVAPPFVDLRSVTSVLEAERASIAVAAQHVSDRENGAFTGEVSVAMLKRLGVSSVIVGHSERRTMYHMDADVVASTVRAVLRGGLETVLCVGEDLATREAEDHESFVSEQLTSALAGVEEFSEHVTVAYEPIWAIGWGLHATPADVTTMHAFIREELCRQFGAHGADIAILYGGSVKPANAAELLALPEVGGALVGGASLAADDFLAIARAAPTRA